jgi:ethanolamine ammonia-lyase small subunit
VSLPTAEVLRFSLAHARARDAVHAPFHAEEIADGLAGLGPSRLVVMSAAPDRAAYLARPDLGRTLSTEGRAALASLGAPGGDVGIVIADGLSATAVHAHAVGLVAELVQRFAAMGLAMAPVVIARGGRVAIGDEIGAALGVAAVLVLIGERPGLSSPDSLGAYLTFAPRAGRSDAERNCVSNIRPEGLPLAAAAFKLAWLTAEALRLKLTGVDLKDESDLALPPPSGVQSVT